MHLLWREQLKKVTTPHQRHKLVMARERLYGPWARATAKWRSQPDFLIIGAHRCGTTHLFNTLRHHPQAKLSRNKETHFFGVDTEYAKGFQYYKSHFPLKLFVGQHDVVGEASPGYLQNAAAAERIQAMLPETKLIALLREPTKRFVSSYHYAQQKQRELHETRSLETLVLNNPSIEQERIFKKGTYVEGLRRYRSYYNASRLLIVRSEDYFAQPQETLVRICRFLDIADDFQFPVLGGRNDSGQSTSSVAPAVVEKLNELYEPYSSALAHEFSITWK